ncbi:hypothetical protein SESBI_03337 [Sesbania bispinosa]|nr:hypothetical protein SESBI_03337 [Sesbania bispinosa]
MAPTDSSRTHGIFRLTTPGGMSVIRQCQQRGFHPHNQPPDGGPIYDTCFTIKPAVDIIMHVMSGCVCKKKKSCREPVVMCSKTAPPHVSFSHDLSESELHVLPMKHDVPCKDTMLLESNPEFEFNTSKGLEFESSSADELFSNGVILPIQIQEKKNTTRKHTHYGESPYMRLPPLPCSPNVDKMKKREVLDVNGGGYEKKTQSKSFWGFSRSKSLNCDTKKSLICSSPPLSRSKSTSSAPNLKRMSSKRQQTTPKPLSSSSSCSSSTSTLNLYPMQKSPSGKSYGGSYANGLRVSPVLNVPTPYYISKGSASLFGLGSFLCVGKDKKGKYIFVATSLMTLLEVIKDASVNSKSLDLPSDYPIVLNPDNIISNLKSEVKNVSSSSLIKPLIGWQISQTDAEIIDISKKFFTQLKTKLKNTNDLEKGEFIVSLNSYLENIREKVGVLIGIDSSSSDYSRILIDKLGCFMSKDAAGLVLDGCVSLEIWEIVEALIVNGIIEHSYYSNLVNRLVEKKRSDLLCLCVKHAFDLGSSEILIILRYFLSPSKDAYNTMVAVKKEWENQALLAIEKASDSNLKRKNLLVAKEASILLMIAYDGFSASDLCLHYLIASANLNDVMLSSSFSKLNGKELINLIRYLAKWLKKYERFPQAGPCPKASSVLGLKACEWVPKLEDVVKCLGLVLDENFSSLVLHPQFHEELRSIEGVVSCLTAEAKLCYLMADVVDKLKIEVKGGDKHRP